MKKVIPTIVFSILLCSQANATPKMFSKLDDIAKANSQRKLAMQQAAQAQYIGNRASHIKQMGGIRNNIGFSQGADAATQQKHMNLLLDNAKPNGNLAYLGVSIKPSYIDNVNKVGTTNQLTVANDFSRYTNTHGNTKLVNTSSKSQNARSDIKGNLGEIMQERALLGSGYKTIPNVQVNTANRSNFDLLAKHPQTGQWAPYDAKVASARYSNAQRNNIDHFAKNGGDVRVPSGQGSYVTTHLPPANTTTFHVAEPRYVTPSSSAGSASTSVRTNYTGTTSSGTTSSNSTSMTNSFNAVSNATK